MFLCRETPWPAKGTGSHIQGVGWQEQPTHSLLHYNLLGRIPAQAHHQFKKVYDSEVLSCKTCCRWFKKFNSGDYILKDLPRSSRIGRGYTELSKQILRMVWESGRQKLVLQGKPLFLFVPFTKTTKVLKGRESPLMTEEARWHLHFVAWSFRQHSTESFHHRPRWKLDLVQ